MINMANVVSDKKKKLLFIAVMAVILLMQLALFCYYGSRKTGFHEDELYTYYSTNKTAGLFVNDRQWMMRDQLRNDFVVLPGEGFRYNVVKQMQSWDVHPPLYYYLIHTVCSLTPGIFSKWQGIGLNLFGYVLSYLLLAYVTYTAASGKKYSTRGRLLALLVCAGWGFSGAVISGVMFIRMYQWLTMWILLCLAIHLRAVKKQDFRIRCFLLPLGLVVLTGFLTQYYYIIFHFFLGLAFCLYLLWGKRIRELFSYVITCALALGMALLYYPSALSHIFRGYRGTEAVSEFGNVSNTGERLRFFYGLFDDYVMYDTLTIWILVIVLLAVTAHFLKKRGKVAGNILNASIGLMAAAAAGYFFTVSKTALLLGETSNRYQLPIYGVLLFLLLYFTWSYLVQILEAVWPAGAFEESTGVKGRGLGILAGTFLVILLVIDGLALRDGRVFFLYEEQAAEKEFVRDNTDVPVVVFYNEASGDHIWWLSDELMEFPGVYLASEENRDPITDEKLTDSKRVLAYVADGDNSEAALDEFFAVNTHLTSMEKIAEREAWTLYELK